MSIQYSSSCSRNSHATEEALLRVWRSEVDTEAITPRQRRELLRQARLEEERELLNLSGSQRPYHLTDAGLQGWKQHTLWVIDAQLDSFTPSSRHLPIATPIPVLGNRVPGRDEHHICQISQTYLPRQTYQIQQTYQALHVPELLDTILRCLDTKTLFSARQVSKDWQSTVEYIFKSQHRACSTQQPVEYGDTINSPNTTDQPSVAEIEVYEREIRWIAEDHSAHTSDGWRVYYPARIAQALAVSDGVSALHRSLYPVRSLCRVQPDLSYAPGPQWLDFSQFEFNPHFEDFLGGRFTVKEGQCEISLRLHPIPSHCVVDPTLIFSPVFDRLMGTMFVTVPPCKSIGIYAQRPEQEISANTSLYDTVQLDLLTRLHNSNGIRVRELLAALTRHSSTLVAMWKTQLQYVREDMEWRDPSYFQYRGRRERILDCTAWPTFTLLLDRDGMSNWADTWGHVSREQYNLVNYYDFDTRQKVWEKMGISFPQTSRNMLKTR